MLDVDTECKLLTENDSIDRYSCLYTFGIHTCIDWAHRIIEKCKILVCGPTIGVQAHRSLELSYNEWAFVVEHEAPP